jgi:microsomal prostaglandin-E synthase 2
MFHSRRLASFSTAFVVNASISDHSAKGLEPQVTPGAFLKVPIALRIPNDFQTSKVTIYQYESCPFCRKVRAALDYSKQPYSVVEVHPLTKSETKEFEYKKVPLLVVEDQNSNKIQLRNSSDIVDAVLLHRLGKIPDIDQQAIRSPVETWKNTEKNWKSDSPNKSDEWIRWTDGYLVHLVVMNIYRTFKEARGTFDYLLTHEKFGFFSKYATYWSGSVVMWFLSRKRRKQYEMNNGEERHALYDALEMFLDSRSKGSKFLGNQDPSRVDFNVYGVVRSMEGLPVFEDIMDEVHGLKEWFTDMEIAIGESAKIQHIGGGTRGNVSL